MTDQLNNRPLLIDTCALTNKDFIKWLKGYHGTKKISSVTYMEYALFYIEKHKWELDKVNNLLKAAGIEVESFEKKQAGYAAHLMAGRTKEFRCDKCEKLDWNDCMIAAHAPYAPTILVTANVDDFPSKGIAIMTPTEIMNVR